MGGRSLFDFFKRNGRRHAQMGMPSVLLGYFELRVNRLVGWVRDKYDSNVGDIHIEVMHRGAAIAACSVTVHPGQRRFEFSLPVEGLFTSAELVKEEVMVLAYDSEGNRGQLRLDGAAQIELIRDNLGAPAVSVLDLDFSSGGNAESFLGDGAMEQIVV